jgi:hydrogenase maturation protein HypF
VVATSSAGRLFDAAAAILGLTQVCGYEAHAAMLLERAAASWDRPSADAPPADLRSVFVDLLEGPGAVPEKAWRFHAGVAAVFADQVGRAAEAAGTTTVGLTGGVAINRVFRAELLARLRQRGLRVLTHRLVPPNDGGLSLGQAWAGRLLPAG